MTDILGFRQKIGLLVPSTNSTVQPEMDDMRPKGVTNHISRIDVPNQSFHTDADAQAIVEATWPDLMPALDRVMACNPDRVIMAMAVPCFWGGVAATEKLKKQMEDRAGVPVTLPPDAIHQALQALGTTQSTDSNKPRQPIRRLGIVSPYMPLADQHVAQWFEEKGYQVEIEGLKAKSEDSVVDVSQQEQSDAFRRLNSRGVDVLIQVGTSMAAAQLAASEERELGRPVLAVNTVCYWATLRNAGINDTHADFGQLLATH